MDIEKFSQESRDLNIAEDVRTLTNEQLKIINRYFTIDNDYNLRDAFEYFGQGSIYDSEKETSSSLFTTLSTTTRSLKINNRDTGRGGSDKEVLLST